VFLREITSSLSKGAAEMPDVEERVGHILRSKGFGTRYHIPHQSTARRRGTARKHANGKTLRLLKASRAIGATSGLSAWSTHGGWLNARIVGQGQSVDRSEGLRPMPMRSSNDDKRLAWPSYLESDMQFDVNHRPTRRIS